MSTDPIYRGRSLRLDVLRLVESMPRFARASAETQQRAAGRIYKQVLAATVDEPLSVDDARKKLAKIGGNAEGRPQILKAHHLRPAAGAKKANPNPARGTKGRYQVRVGLDSGTPSSVRMRRLRIKNPFRVQYQVVNLERLAELYPKGGNVTIGDLVAKGAIRKNDKVKVLGSGDISVRLNVVVDKVDDRAAAKIRSAGGTVEASSS